jgi:hypothetical protein
MTSKQVAPPFAKPENTQVSKEIVETDHITEGTGNAEEMGEVQTTPVEGLSDAVEEELAKAPAPDVEGEAYWASGGNIIGGLTLGNRAAPQAASSVSETKVGGGTGINPFKPEPGNQSNPFKRIERKVEKVEQVRMFDVPVGTPSWRDFVNFVLEHAADIVKVRYPNPPRNAELIAEMNALRAKQVSRGKEIDRGGLEDVVNVIDTIYKGIPVVNAGRVEIQHVRYGWASWEDCQS